MLLFVVQVLLPGLTIDVISDPSFVERLQTMKDFLAMMLTLLFYVIVSVSVVGVSVWWACRRLRLPARK